MDHLSNQEIADLVEAVYLNSDKNFGHFKGGLKEAVKRLRLRHACPVDDKLCAGYRGVDGCPHQPEYAYDALRQAQKEADRLPGGSDYKRFVLLNDAITAFLAEREKDDYIPTKRGRFCNLRDGMGNGCKDSWWSGGNYGGALCRNPYHHDAPTREQLDAEAELKKNDE